MAKRYASVLEMVRDTVPDETFHDELEGYLADYNVSRALSTLRCTQKLTQSELARRTRCNQSRISRIENSQNDRLKLDDLAIYARAFNLQISIAFRQETTAVDSIKRLAFQIKNHLDELAEMVNDDKVIHEGVSQFYEEFLFNMLYLFMDSLGRIRGRSPGPADLREVAKMAHNITMDLVSQSQALLPLQDAKDLPKFRVVTPTVMSEESGNKDPNQAHEVALTT